MPTIRTENPRQFRAQADAMVAAINEIEKAIINRHRAAQTIVCCDCGATAPVADARLRFDGAVICGSCLPKWAFCQVQNRYFPSREVATYFDGAATEKQSAPLQMHQRNGRYNTFTCAKCNGAFYGSALTLITGTRRASVCMACASAAGTRCEGCSAFYTDATQADSCCGDRMHYEYRDPKFDIQMGTDFSRFSKRPVGLEIETGQNGRKTRVLRYLNRNLPTWGMMSDGSLCEGGYEYVSSPMTGNLIEDSYKGFIKAMEEADVTVEHPRAGYHVHVNAKDIYGFIENLRSESKTAQADTCEDIMQRWGKVMIGLSQSIVAPWRRNSNFCQGNFGYRSSKGQHPSCLRKASGSSYPPVAIRQHTLEFRIFPSTANVEWHLARIEFAQKSVDLLWEAMQDTAAAEKLTRMFRAMEGLAGQAKMDYLCLDLGLSEDSKRAIQKMHKHWTPTEYADGKAVNSEYKKEPKPRKPRTARSKATEEDEEEVAS